MDHNRFIEPRITWREATVTTDEGVTVRDCLATYHDPQLLITTHGKGDTVDHALEDLYEHLDRLGYDRAELPTPEPE